MTVGGDDGYNGGVLDACRNCFVAVSLIRIILVLAAAWCVGGGVWGCAAVQSESGSGSGSDAGGEGGGGTLTVFAAASLTEAFGELGEAFADGYPDVAVRLHFAGSQTLRTQLEQGALADVFAPADWRQMAAVKDAGLLGGVPVYFAANRMAVAVPGPRRSDAGTDAAAAVSTLADLARPGVTVALATEETPAGAYARQSLDLMAADPGFPAGFADAVLSNVATRETSVRAVAQKVALGEVDAGLIYETDAMQYADAVRMIEIPLHLNPAAQYPIARLAGAAHPEIAAAFVEYALSDAGQGILRRHGFAPPANVACPCAKSGSKGDAGIDGFPDGSDGTVRY